MIKRNHVIVTMIYNEDHFLPLWCDYYSKIYGAANLIIIDHGSSIEYNLPREVNVIKIPRSPMNDLLRSNFISQFCSSLLTWYESVTYTDVDEFLIANPFKYASLSDYLDQNKASSVTAYGFNLFDFEKNIIDSKLSILSQRKKMRFQFAMCKSLLVREKVVWSPGFHTSNHEINFDDLFLIHLHHYDLSHSLARLSKTRAMPWEYIKAGAHQRIQDVEYLEMIESILNLPIMHLTNQELSNFLNVRVERIKEYLSTSKDKKIYTINPPLNDQLVVFPAEYNQIF
jgi:hypothetical protein